MAQVAQQDPSTAAPKDPSLPVDDTALTQPRLPTYHHLHGEPLSYSTHQFVNRSHSHSAQQPTRTMQQSSHPPEDNLVPTPQSQLDRDRFASNPSLRSSNPASVEPPPSKSDATATKTHPFTEQDPSGRVDDPETTPPLYREGPVTTGDFVATTPISNVDQVTTSSNPHHVSDPDERPAVGSPGTESADSTQPLASPDEVSDSPHGDSHPGHFHPESAEASPHQSVPVDQYPPNHAMYNMVASFGDMNLNPMQYGGSVPMIPMQPHPLPLSPQHAAHVAHHQRQQQMFQQQQPQTYYLWVPQERVGAVIGGHGAVIRSLQEQSGASIQVHNDTIRGEHKLFTIIGNLAQYEAAAQLVNEIVERPRPSAHTGSSVSSERSHYSVLGDHPSRGTDVCKTVYVPSRCVGLVIGRNGETIRSLQDKSGAIIKVTRNEDAAPGAESRSILISGTEEAIAHAHQLVSEIVMEARARRSPQLNPPVGAGLGGPQLIMETLAIPNDKVGLIIGKKGTTIRDLQMRSGAKIQVTKDDNCLQNDGSRPVTITGNRSNVDEAKGMIANKINIPMLPAIQATAAFPVGARPTHMAHQAPGQAVPYIFPSHLYEPGFQNGQESFPQIFEPGDPSNQGRGAVTYFPYMGYNNYPAMSQHARGFQHPVPMQYGPPQPAIQEQQGMQVPPSDQQDSNAQPPFPSPNIKPGQPMEIPGSPTMLSRDANGGIVMYQGNPFPQLAQIPPQHPMFHPPPNSRMFAHREHPHAHVQAQLLAQAQAQAQAQARAQVNPTQAGSSTAQSPATIRTQAKVEAQAGSEQPMHVHSSEDEVRNQTASAPEEEQSST